MSGLEMCIYHIEVDCSRLKFDLGPVCRIDCSLCVRFKQDLDTISSIPLTLSQPLTFLSSLLTASLFDAVALARQF